MTSWRADERARHRIRIQGRLDPAQAARLGETTLAVHGTGATAVTDITAWVADQAALMGVLEQLYSLGVTLISVERLESDDEAPQ
jgi:hypothetical protein